MTQEEQRKTDRHGLSLNTEVHYSETELHGMFRCRTQNIGLGGAFIAAAGLPLDSGTAVELVLNAEPAPSRDTFRVQARVVRVTDDGVGLSFNDLSPEDSRVFRRFLLQAKVARRH